MKEEYGMENTSTIDIRSARQHLLAKYNQEDREFEIVHKGEVTIIRILPDGDIEVANYESVSIR